MAWDTRLIVLGRQTNSPRILLKKLARVKYSRLRPFDQCSVPPYLYYFHTLAIYLVSRAEGELSGLTRFLRHFYKSSRHAT